MQWTSFRLFIRVCPVFALARRERSVVRRVDIVLASSSALKLRWSAIHNDVRLVPQRTRFVRHAVFGAGRFCRPPRRSLAMSGPLPHGLIGLGCVLWQKLGRVMRSAWWAWFLRSQPANYPQMFACCPLVVMLPRCKRWRSFMLD